MRRCCCRRKLHRRDGANTRNNGRGDDQGRGLSMKSAMRTVRATIMLSLAAAGFLAAAPPAADADDAAVLGLASAAAAAPGATEIPRGEGGLQEVVVTATRREEELSKVPISVTALTQEAIDSMGIQDFRDVARFTPGATIDDSGTNPIAIGGISSSG